MVHNSEKCTLREWLNGDFVREAFSSEEQKSILSTTVTAGKNPKYETPAGNNTTDQVFLLNITEANKYFSSDSVRQCQGTVYCYAQGAYKANNGNCWWWLRSPGYLSISAANVNHDGSVNDLGISVDEDGSGVNDDGGAVRPALWIDLES